MYWNGEEEDGDDEEPKEEREKINGYSVEEKHDKPLSGPMQKSADPILPFIGLRLLRRAFTVAVAAEDGDLVNSSKLVTRTEINWFKTVRE